MSEFRQKMIGPDDGSESPVMDVERNGWLELPLGELVVAVARYRLKFFNKHAEASEETMWLRAATEAEGDVAMTWQKACILVSVIIFVLASLGSWPHVVSDFEPLALGLAFFAAGHF